ncbi:cytochrome b [Rhodoferax sp. PAMC 29310]|uniref:cytochrome b n=1 Tax=Rhodoferax sp. PAMC 29310 TaxID=2822760 RepID=UPI001B333424|nr:cytochrome b [Rhodoferax sp. PAMC 29310]
MANSTTSRYGHLAQLFHWTTAILVLAAFIYGPGGSELRVYLPSRDFERQLHETLGLCVFAMVALRLMWRWFDTRPAAGASSAWMALTAKLVQLSLYVLLFAVPMSAIAGAWLEGHPLTLLAGIEIAPPIGISHDLGATIAEIHTWLGDAILWLAGLHAAAAIFHHVILKDRVLLTMLPRWLPLRQR